MTSQQIQSTALSVHFRGASCSISGEKAVIAVDALGLIEIFSPSETAYVEKKWSMLLAFERAQGWLSLHPLKIQDTAYVNGHLLKDSPLLLRETTLMQPPHSRESIELFLCESLAEWQKEIGDVSDKTPKYPSLDSVAAVKLGRAHQEHLGAEYGLLAHSGEYQAIDACYHFGALRFELTDGEFWVNADDGVLKINNKACPSGKLYVGDQVQWQESAWAVVGCSALCRPKEMVALPKKPPLEKRTNTVVALIDTSAPDDQEFKIFREKIDSWIAAAPELSPSELDPYESGPIAAMDPSSEMALLRLGRRSHAWRNLHDDGGVELPGAPVKSRHRVSQGFVTTFAAVIIGILAGVLVTSFF